VTAELHYIPAGGALAACWRLVIWDGAHIRDVYECATYRTLRGIAKSSGFAMPTELRAKRALTDWENMVLAGKTCDTMFKMEIPAIQH